MSVKLRAEQERRRQAKEDLRDAINCLIDAAVDGDLEQVSNYLADAMNHQKRVWKHDKKIEELVDE